MFLRDVPIRILLVAGFLISGLLPLMAVALMSLSIAKEELTNQAFRQLESVRDIKKNQLERFFNGRVNQTEVLAVDPYLVEALKDLSQLIDGPDGIGRTGFLGRKSGRFDAPPAYREAHDALIGFFEKYAEGNEYYDVFLMDPVDGFTLLTVKKEADFGVPIGQVDSSLRDVWRKAVEETAVAVSDTKPYSPSGDIPAQFIAAPVLEGGRTIGVVAVQISLDTIDEIMSARSGMGRTGETYLVGSDRLMRSDSYLDQLGHSVAASFGGTVVENGVDTRAVAEAFDGNTGADRIVDYNGNMVLSAYAPVTFYGVTWALIAEIDEAEIDARIAHALNARITIIIFLSLALLLVLALAISMFISKGVARVNHELNDLIDGVLSDKEGHRGDPQRVAYDFRGVVRKTNNLIDAYQTKTNESKKLEEAIAHNQRMESLGTLAGGIAHDFNNILAYMLTYGDLVLEDLEERSPAHSRMLEILRGIDRAGELVAQIMTFGRQLKQERRPVEVALLVKEASKLIKATMPKNIRVRCSIESTGTTVMADPPQIHQIVMNLCTNAFHAMLGSGGEMVISVSEDAVDETGPKGLSPGRYCVISVSDTGCGIDPSIIDRIFDPFFTTKPVGQGTGMGLAVVHGIVTSYKGCVTFESSRGAGTVARVYLPTCDDAAVIEEPSARSHVARGSGRILLVDDEEPICVSTSLMLESLGYEVDFDTDSVSARDRFLVDPNAYDALVTDINMPGLNGIDLARRLREARRDLPIILITGYNELTGTNEIASLAAHVLLKPFKKSDFSVLLSQAMNDRVDIAH